MGNKDKTFKKCRRKIRIRLANPNDPDSYICEVFDSSLENENEENDSERVNFSPESKEDPSKPRNYFEVLMSNDCRRSNKVKPNAGEQNFERTFEEKRSKKGEVKQKTIENGLGIKRKAESESSDDENLLQLKNKFQLQNISIEEIEACEEINDVTEIAGSEEELFTIFESPKVDSNKKTLSILNYFSKATPKNTGVQIKVKNAEEIKNSRINQRNNLVACKNVENSTRSEKKLNKEKNTELNKENVKLAPLFHKKEKKIFDSTAQKARLDFLFNSPSIAKKVENKTNENDVKFLEVVHVQQRNDSPCWSPREITLPFLKISTADFVNGSKGGKKFRFCITNPSLIEKSVSCPKIQINKDLINKLKSKYINLNLGQVIDNLKQKRDEFQCLAGGLEKSKNSKKSTENDEMGYEVLNTLWIDKYKPGSGDILGNGKVVKKLRDWLESWKSFDEALKALIKSKPKSKCESDDDDDAFMDSDGENYGLKTPGNVCILSGPHGCGKTAVVSALANELEFKVLELNASSKRTGRKILSDLQEATQSHKMHRSVLPNGMPLAEPKKKRKRKKGKKLNDAATFAQPNHSDCKISLILIEDAEIIFEDHDEGFIPAIISLAQTSKRPLIFITNDPNCGYLDNFKKDQCLILEMERACFYKSCAVLDIVSSLEGVYIDEEFLKFLVLRNHFDLRKSLLELQFWTNHIENCLSIRKPFNLGQLWWGLGKFLYKKEFKKHITSKGCKRKRQDDLFDSSDDDEELVVKKSKLNLGPAENITVLNQEMFRGKPNPMVGSYYKILGLISVVDNYCGSVSNEPVFEFECRAKDGLSLEENLEEVDFREKTLADELAEELVKLSTEIFAKDIREKKNEERKFYFSSPSWEEIRWQKSQEEVSKELSNIIPLQSVGDKRSLSLDYLPIIRNICRIEKSRAEFQPKRKNRFYHYLSNLGAKFDECILESCCKVFTR